MYQVNQTPTVIVDHDHLQYLRNAMTDESTRGVVVGWGEYAKHLINFFGERIAAVYDPRSELHGIAFRGVKVIDVTEEVHPINRVLCGEYQFLADYLPKIVDLYGGAQLVVPPRMHYKPTSEVKVFEQEELYKYIAREEHAAPVSMMAREKISFLLELLRFGLTKPGIVVEMGSWQGGSAWYMAKALGYLGETRPLFMMDLFEDHVMDPTATMCTEEIRRKMSVYPHAKMVQGLVDDRACLDQLEGQPICFAHMDLGPAPVALEHLWEHLSPGAPLLLDNYGHLAAPPWAFDRFIEARGARIIRLPWSEQGLTFKSAEASGNSHRKTESERSSPSKPKRAFPWSRQG